MYKWTPERFWEKVERRGPDDCWEWQGARTTPGWHGASWGPNGRKETAHRVAWHLTNGPIPDGLFVLHSCDNPPCCNPAHLWLGTLKDNSQDAARKGRTGPQIRDWSKCKRGHALEGDNIYIHPSTKRRMCRTCHHQRAADWRAAHKAA